jgi:hypothetical protein
MSNIGLMTKLEPVDACVRRRGVSRRRSGMIRFHDFLRIDHLRFVIPSPHLLNERFSIW